MKGFSSYKLRPARHAYLLQLGFSPVRRRAAVDRRADGRPARGAMLATAGAALR
jgi:hypothetical protein